MEFTIGWSSKNDIQIENADIFETHCAVEKSSGSTLFVRNLNKNSKTFVNGEAIAKAELKPGDILALNGHHIEYSWLKDTIENIATEIPVDYKQKFEELKQLYQEYQQNVKQINRKYQRQDGILRMSFSLLPVAASIVLTKELGIHAYVPGCLASAFVTAVSFATNASSKAKDELSDLKLDFLLKYKCPKCSTRFGETDWRLLADQKKCSSCKVEII